MFATIVLALVGFLAGKLFVLPVLMILTIASIIIAAYLAIAKKELEGLVTIIFGYFALVFNMAMWITYYIATNQFWFTDFFKMYIFR